MGLPMKAPSATLILVTLFLYLANQSLAIERPHFPHLLKSYKNRFIMKLINQINNLNLSKLSEENELYAGRKSFRRKPIAHDPRMGHSTVQSLNQDLRNLKLENELMEYLELSDMVEGAPNRSFRDNQLDSKAPWTLERSQPKCRRRNFIAGVTNYWFVCSDRRPNPLNDQLILSRLKDPTKEESLRMLLDIKSG